MITHRNIHTRRRYLGEAIPSERYSAIQASTDSIFRIHKVFLKSGRWMIFNCDSGSVEGPYSNLQAALDDSVVLLGNRVGSIEIDIGSTFPIIYAEQRKNKGKLELEIEENWEQLALIISEFVKS